VLANVAVGALQGLVPLAVTFGAVLLFEVMAVTGCLQYIMGHVRRMSAGNRIAEVFLMGGRSPTQCQVRNVSHCLPDGRKLPRTIHDCCPTHGSGCHVYA
jgi:hypothetical protein